MIIIKTEKEIALMRQGGRILADVLKRIVHAVRPGITTGELEKMACALIKEAGGRPAFKGYQSFYDSRPFPTALCASINEEVVHAPALPARTLRSGDIIGLDIGMEYPAGAKSGGYYTDMAATVGVGKISREAKKLIETTRHCLQLAIREVKPGNTLNDIGRAIQHYAEARGFSVVRELVGHGIGKEIHEELKVPNYEVKDKDWEDVILKPGIVIAIEPMINAGGWKVKDAADGFTIVTADRGLSAHFEHTVAVMKDGHKILTIC